MKITVCIIFVGWHLLTCFTFFLLYIQKDIRNGRGPQMSSFDDLWHRVPANINNPLPQKKEKRNETRYNNNKYTNRNIYIITSIALWTLCWLDKLKFKSAETLLFFLSLLFSACIIIVENDDDLFEFSRFCWPACLPVCCRVQKRM